MRQAILHRKLTHPPTPPPNLLQTKMFRPCFFIWSPLKRRHLFDSSAFYFNLHAITFVVLAPTRLLPKNRSSFYFEITLMHFIFNLFCSIGPNTTFDDRWIVIQLSKKTDEFIETFKVILFSVTDSIMRYEKFF